MDFWYFYNFQWISLEITEFPIFLQNFEKRSPLAALPRECAQTLKNLRNYIGSGGGNQPGDHQNRSRSRNITIFALWMTFLWNSTRNYEI